MNLRILPIAALSLALSACASTDNGYRGNDYYGSTSTYSRVSGNCYDCGVVQRIESYTGERRATGAGAVVGAVVGGALGNQVGKGDGKTAATVAGAVAGGLAGNAIEKRTGDQTWFNVTVLMNDGRTIVVTQDDLNGVREGSRVVVRDGEARLD
jgi:outer membrane lipoprotein SlyB